MNANLHCKFFGKFCSSEIHMLSLFKLATLSKQLFYNNLFFRKLSHGGKSPPNYTHVLRDILVNLRLLPMDGLTV